MPAAPDHADPTTAPPPKGREEFRDGVPFIGGRTWIDFVNTRPLDAAGRPVDLIATPAAFATWTGLAGIAAPSPDEAGASEHADALALREVMRDLFETAREGLPPSDAALGAIDRALDGVTIRLRLERSAGGLRLVERLDTGACGAIAADFSRFVCDFEPARLKHCSNPACSMVFYDVGKNNRRRWCSMSVCGNRDKVARFRLRHAEHG